MKGTQTTTPSPASPRMGNVLELQARRRRVAEERRLTNDRRRATGGEREKTRQMVISVFTRSETLSLRGMTDTILNQTVLAFWWGLASGVLVSMWMTCHKGSQNDICGKESKTEWLYVSIKPIHFAVHLKLTQYCKSRYAPIKVKKKRKRYPKDHRLAPSRLLTKWKKREKQRKQKSKMITKVKLEKKKNWNT